MNAYYIEIEHADGSFQSLNMLEVMERFCESFNSMNSEATAQVIELEVEDDDEDDEDGEAEANGWVQY